MNTKDLLIITECPDCGGRMYDNTCPYCNASVSGTCPECGSYTWDRDPATDSTQGTYCSNDVCPYTYNQYIEWEVIREDYVCEFCGELKNVHGVCSNCPETGEEDEPVAQCGCCGEWTEECNMREGMCSYCFSVNVGE